MTSAPAPDVRENRSDATTRLFTLLAQAGPDERAEIETRIIHRNMAMAVDATRRFRGRGISDDDLQQVAYLGLVKAVRGFDAERGHDFMSYAVPTIRGEVRRHFRDLGWAVRPPRSVQEAQAKILGCQSELVQLLGRSPRPSDFATHLGLDLELVIDALGANGCFAPTSLDAQDDGNEPIGARLGYVDPGFDRAEARAILQPLLDRLSPRERTIVEMRYFRGCTQAQIGAEIGVTQMQVSRLLARLMARMRAEIDHDYPEAA